MKVVDVTHVALGLERHRQSRQSRRQSRAKSQSQKKRLHQRCWPSSSSSSPRRRRRLHVVVPTTTSVCSLQLIFFQLLKLQKNEG